MEWGIYQHTLQIYEKGYLILLHIAHWAFLKEKVQKIFDDQYCVFLAVS